MDTAVKSFDDLANLRDAYIKEVKKNGEKLFADAIKDFFEKCPEVNGVRWTQYAPHFNDGEACIFGVNEPEFRFEEKSEEKSEDQDDDDDYGEDNDGWLDSYYLDKAHVSEETNKAIDKLSAQIQSNDDAMEIIFGDGVQVTCIKGEGISSDWYDHD